MPLTPMNNLLATARSEGYGVCYCESWNLESFQAVVGAAEEMAVPIIAGFNGGFLCHSSRKQPERLSYYAGLSAALREASIPVAFILNETDNLAQIEEGIRLGFNAVMVEGDGLDPQTYQQLVKQVVRLAHKQGVSVEAQIGRLPHGEAGHPEGHATDPKRVRDFVQATGIDSLGISIGNVHILTHGKAEIDLGLLAKIRQEVSIPLVIHGGTGFPPDLAPQAIALGVAKFNFGTNLKQTYLAALKDRLMAYNEPMNPHPFLGMGGPQDILKAAFEAVKLKVKELIQCYTLAGRSNKSSAKQYS
jgi:ketose-bisphosphate aldolase